MVDESISQLFRNRVVNMWAYVKQVYFISYNSLTEWRMTQVELEMTRFEGLKNEEWYDM